MTDTETRDWAAVREAAIQAVRDAIPHWPESDCEEVADAVLAVCDEEAVNRMAAEFVNRSFLRSLDVRDGAAHLEMIPAQEVIAAWALAARGMLDGTGAENYTETSMEFPDRARGERYVFILQRVAPGKLTPHEARHRAEAEAQLAGMNAAQFERNWHADRDKLAKVRSLAARLPRLTAASRPAEVIQRELYAILDGTDG